MLQLEPIQSVPYPAPIPDVERRGLALAAGIVPGDCQGHEACRNPTDNAPSKPALASRTYARRQPREARDNRHRDSRERETSIADCKSRAAPTNSVDCSV